MKHIITICLLLFTATIASAQKNLDTLMNRLIDGQKGVEVIFSEQRDPVTKSIVNLSFMVTSTDKSLKNEIIKAFEQDRPAATAYSKVGRGIYSITFNANGMVKAFSLIIDEDDDEWMFSSNTKPVDGKQ